MQLPAGFQARQLKPETDIVAFDMVLVMDKFTAADVLREVGLNLHARQRPLKHASHFSKVSAWSKGELSCTCTEGV